MGFQLKSIATKEERSSLIKQLCRLTGIQKSKTTPYHPMGNGQAEQFNSTLLNMLGTLNPPKKLD